MDISEFQPPPPSDREFVDSRLDEIELRLAELRQTTESFTQPTTTKPALPSLDAREASRQLELRHEELQGRAEQIATETRRLQERADRVAEREANLERQRQELSQEADRIANVAQAARQSIAEEHTQHQAAWRDWDVTYARMSDDLATQLGTINRQRQTLQDAADRLAVVRCDLQRERTVFEQQQQSLIVDRLALANDRAELSALKSELDFRSQRQQLEADERDARIQVDLREIGRCQTDLLSAHQNLERERLSLLAERSAHLQRLDQENQQQIKLQMLLDEDRRKLAVERDELLILTGEMQRTRSALDAERSQFESARGVAKETDHELQRLRDRCRAADEELARLRTRLDAMPTATTVPQFDAVRGAADLQLSAALSTTSSSPSSLTLPSAPSAALETLAVAKPLLQCDFNSVPTGVDVMTESVVAPRHAPSQHAPPRHAPSPLPPTSSENTESFGVMVDWTDISIAPHDLGHESAAASTAHEPFDFDHAPGHSACETNRHSACETTKVESPGTGEPAFVRPANDASQWTAPKTNLGAPLPSNLGAYPWATQSASLESTSAFNAQPSSAFNAQPSSLYDIDQATADPWAVPAVPDSLSVRPAPEQEDCNGPRFEGSFGDQPSGEQPSAATVPVDVSTTITVLERATSEDSLPNFCVGATLAAVNRDFGVPVDEPRLEPSLHNPLPAWWSEAPPAALPDSEHPADDDRPSWVVDAMRASPASTNDLPSKSADHAILENSETGLRSQLAMLFDLPASALEDRANAVLMDRADPSGDDSVVEAESRTAEVDKLDDESSPAVSDTDSGIAVAEIEPAEKQAEDSVDAFMARLLARSRVTESETKASVAKRSSTPHFVLPKTPPAAPPPVILTAAESADRSHLSAEPKHKQDKQAVRENLQSFRQVARLSAHSALAKHSFVQLRNATIAKGVLLGVSAVATGMFFVETLFGNPLQLWKASACTLATLLSAFEVRRSWCQLHKPLLSPKSHREATRGEEHNASQAANAARQPSADRTASTAELPAGMTNDDASA